MTSGIMKAALAAAFAALAMPAAAQSLCGGLGDSGQWIGGDEASSDIATSTAYLEQLALVLQGTQYVALFSVSAPTDVRIEAEGRGAGDPVIDLRNAAGDIVVSDDDSGGNGASRAEISLEPGQYCLSMGSYDGSPMTGFVRVGRLEHEALTDGMVTDEPVYDDTYPASCDLATARPLGEGGPINAALEGGPISVTGSASEVPFWSFELSEPLAITLTAENEAADPSIVLYDEWGGYLYENDDFNGLNSQIDITYPLQPGRYCIAVTALSDVSMPITMTIAPYDAAAAMLGMYDRGEASPPLDGSYPVVVLGDIGNRFRTDIQTTTTTTWFAVDMSEAGLLLVEAVTNNMGDPTLVLFDDFGRQLAYNDDHGDGLDSMVTARVMPGTYLVGVRQLSEGSPVLTRLLFERYVPAPK